MPLMKLTVGRIASFGCPAGKSQDFLRDAETKGLALRVTTAGARAYVFEAKLGGKTVRVTIGDPSVYSIADAQREARRLQSLVDAGRDPREVKAEAIAADEAKRAARRREGVTVGEAWAVYVEERRPFWSERHYADHLKLAQEGGRDRLRGEGKTTPGPLATLMPLRLQDLNAECVQQWAKKESAKRAARTRLALRLLNAFLGWCARRPAYALAASSAVASGKDVKEIVGKPGRRSDVLQREQLAAWFGAVRTMTNPVLSAYLQCLLLTGARREEMAGLRWKDLDFRWQSMTIGDKVEGTRTIPLTPYVASLLRVLPRPKDASGAPSPWVFSSPTSASGRVVAPARAMERACTVAGIEDLTLHGLRRSFGTLAEWVECPAGVVAQIQGHKPSAIAEKHYRVRPLDLLRLWHERIEAWMLEQAGVPFVTPSKAGPLQVVNG